MLVLSSFSKPTTVVLFVYNLITYTIIITGKAMMKTQCVARGGALQIFHNMYVAVEQ